MPWEIAFTPQAERWLRGLTGRERSAMVAALDKLAAEGPGLGRPAADRIKGSRHHNMKELRSFGGHQRALFAFDPRRTAIVLIGGDKTNNWKGWYRENIPKADRLYDDHLRRGGDGRWPTGERSGGRSR
jgi:hypothetical protein